MIYFIRKESCPELKILFWMRKPSGMTSDFSSTYCHNHTPVIVQILVPYCFDIFQEGMNLHHDQEGDFPCRSLIASEVLMPVNFPAQIMWLSFVGGGALFACFPGNWKQDWEISDCTRPNGIREVPYISERSWQRVAWKPVVVHLFHC